MIQVEIPDHRTCALRRWTLSQSGNSSGGTSLIHPIHYTATPTRSLVAYSISKLHLICCNLPLLIFCGIYLCRGSYYRLWWGRGTTGGPVGLVIANSRPRKVVLLHGPGVCLEGWGTRVADDHWAQGAPILTVPTTPYTHPPVFLRPYLHNAAAAAGAQGDYTRVLCGVCPPIEIRWAIGTEAAQSSRPRNNHFDLCWPGFWPAWQATVNIGQNSRAKWRA